MQEAVATSGCGGEEEEEEVLCGDADEPRAHHEKDLASAPHGKSTGTSSSSPASVRYSCMP